jgi:hypothetical protein
VLALHQRGSKMTRSASAVKRHCRFLDLPGRALHPRPQRLGRHEYLHYADPRRTSSQDSNPKSSGRLSGLRCRMRIMWSISSTSSVRILLLPGVYMASWSCTGLGRKSSPNAVCDVSGLRAAGKPDRACCPAGTRLVPGHEHVVTL